MIPRRDWRDAREWHTTPPRKFRCRVCGRYEHVQLAHTIGRTYDEKRGSTRYVHPLSVVPLCEAHHRAYDAHEFSLNPFLTTDERQWAVDRIGYGNAMRVIVGRAFLKGDIE